MGYRVAILGCRGRGTAAGRAYKAHPDTEVVGLCDLLQDRLDTLGDELGVSARYADLDRMIEETAPDIVAIPVGTEFHYDLGMRVLGHGVHIDIEKPICIDLEQADRLVEKSREVGREIAVHHQGRTGSAMRAVRQAYEDGRIGELRYVTAGGKGYYGGYGLMNIGTHTINNILSLTGPCLQVSAHAVTGGHIVFPEDVVRSPSGMGTICGEHITATMAFDNGVTATLAQHRFPEMDGRGYHAVYHGTTGRIYWGNGAAWVTEDAHGGPDTRWQPLELETPECNPDAGAAVDDVWFVDAFVRALETGEAHPSDGVEGRHVLEILMGTFESIVERRPVPLPQADRSHPLIRWRRAAGLGDPPEVPRPYAEWLAAEDERIRASRKVIA